MNETANIFVTDAQMRSSLAVIRSLGKRGFKVTAGEETRFATGFFSKYCNNHVVYPPPLKQKKDFIEYLIATLQKNTCDLLIPVANPTLEPIIENEKELSQYVNIALPPRETFMKGYDKQTTLKIALGNSIPCPKTHFIEHLDDIYNIEDLLEYPQTIKPTISFGSRGFDTCNSFDQLIEKAERSLSNYNTILLQEYIPNGGEFGVYTLFNSCSRPCALTVQKRLRSYPISGGPSTLRETFHTETSEIAVNAAFRLLNAMKWVGVAMVEFRIDSRDGIPKLMEVNPRFWGSLALSIQAGVDFPYLLYKQFIDGDVKPVLDYKDGVKCRWLLPGDILWFCSAPNKLRNLPKLLDFRIKDDIVSFTDPMPTFGFFTAVARYLFDLDMWKFIFRR